MDVNTIQTLITSVGFPIVCVLALGWFIYKAFEKFTAQSEKREDGLSTLFQTNFFRSFPRYCTGV